MTKEREAVFRGDLQRKGLTVIREGPWEFIVHDDEILEDTDRRVGRLDVSATIDLLTQKMMVMPSLEEVRSYARKLVEANPNPPSGILAADINYFTPTPTAPSIDYKNLAARILASRFDLSDSALTNLGFMGLTERLDPHQGQGLLARVVGRMLSAISGTIQTREDIDHLLTNGTIVRIRK
jgi:hypothetical protein